MVNSILTEMDSQLLKMTVDPSFFLSGESTFTDSLSLAIGNALILSFSISPLLLLAFRNLMFQGLYYGLAWYTGIAFGTIIFLSLIYSGSIFFIDTWYSLEPVLSLISYFIFFKIFSFFSSKNSFSSSLDKSRELIEKNNTVTLFQGFLAATLLSLANPTVINSHLISFPFNSLILKLSFFLIFGVFSVIFTLGWHLILKLLIVNISKLSPYSSSFVLEKSSVSSLNRGLTEQDRTLNWPFFNSRSPFANKLNQIFSLLASILIITSLVQTHWRLFLQFPVENFTNSIFPKKLENTKKSEILRQFEFDYNIDLNRKEKLGLSSKIRRNINVDYPKVPTSTKFENFSLYSNSELSDRPRSRYLIEIAKNQSDNVLPDLQEKGSNFSLIQDKERFNGFDYNLGTNRLEFFEEKTYSYDRNYPRTARPLPTRSTPFELNQLKAVAKQFEPDGGLLPTKVLKRYYLNPWKKVQTTLLNFQIKVQKNLGIFSENKNSLEALGKYKLEESKILYHLSLQELEEFSKSSLLTFPKLENEVKLPWTDGKLHFKRKNINVDTFDNSLRIQPVLQTFK